MKFKHLIFTLLFALLSAQLLKAETFKAGSYIINMGIVPQTYDNGLKPYGMVYDMVINHEVPLYWIIRPGKKLWEKDFTYNDVDYQAGSLVLPAIYVTPTIVTAIAEWRALGVVIDGPTGLDFDAPAYNYISSFPNAVLDQQNAGLTEKLFYDHTAIPGNYYSTGTPADIDVCCDVYALPHADPQKWSNEDKATYLAYTDSKAQSFLWQGCHSVGAVEADDPFLEMHVLTTDGQISWDKDPDYDFKNDNTPDYLYDLSSGDHPIMQIAEPLDDSSIASLLVQSDFLITEDITIHLQDTFKISNDAQDINISTHVVIECKNFDLGENVTINIMSGGSLTILATLDSIFRKNSSVVTVDGPEQFIFMGLNKLQLGDDGVTESYDGFYYTDGELIIKKSTTVNGATTSNDKVTLKESDPAKADVSRVIYDAAAAAKVDTSPPVTNGFTDAALFPEAMFIVPDSDKPNFNVDIGNKEDGNLDTVPVELPPYEPEALPPFSVNYDKVTIPEDSTADDGDQGSSALQDGSQKIYIPRPKTVNEPNSDWRSTTTVAIWDPDNVNNTLNGNTNKAALVAFGRAFGDPLNGILVQHASHSARTGTEAQNVSSARIYGNLLLQASIEKRPIVTIHAPNSLYFPNEYNMTATVERGAGPFDFDWNVTCPLQEGNFSNPGIFIPPTQTDVNESHVIFKPNNNTLSNCILRVKVTDFCGRKNFATKILGITGYHPPLGHYNVTHADESFEGGKDPLETTHPVNSLYTQISNKSFDVTLVALDEDKETLKAKSGNVILELIDTAGVTELEPSSCADATVYSNLTGNVHPGNGNIQFDNSATVTASGISSPNAIKEIGFRISYYDLPLQDNNDAFSYGIPDSMNKADLDGQFPACAPSCSDTPQLDWDCYRCIAKPAFIGGYGKAVCARDNFAVRPAAFSMDLDGIAPFIGGRAYPLQLKAVKFDEVTIDNWYTEGGGNLLFSPIEDANISSILTIPDGCSLSELDPVVWDDSSIKFTSGVGKQGDGSDILFTYPNVGDVNITAVENKWVNADKDKSYTDANEVEKTYSDCIEGSGSNEPVSGKIGCMIEGEHEATFIPSTFKNTLKLENHNSTGNFSYIADNEDGTTTYGAKMTVTHTAVLDDNATVATYYTAGCYANEIESTITLDRNDALAWIDMQGRIWIYDINASSLLTKVAPASFTNLYSETRFNSGTATTNMLFDFDRKNHFTDNPFKLDYTDFDIPDVHDTVNTSVVGSDFNRTAGNESDATFYYARAKSSELLYDDIEENITQTPISVVVYCNEFLVSCSEINGPKINEPYWWLSVDHDKANGDGNIKLISPPTVTDGTGNPRIIPDTDITILAAQNGKDDDVYVDSVATEWPLKTKIYLDTATSTDTSPWLIYNPYADTDPDPFYKVNFIGGGGGAGGGTGAGIGWTGYGKTGNVVDSDANRKKLKRLEW